MFRKNIDRRRLLQSAAILPIGLSFGSGLWAAGASKPKQPNIIYIVADDLGYADLDVFGGHGYKTPFLDRMAQESLMVRQAYANSSVCSPSRVALITGRYPGRLRVGLEEPIAKADPEVGLPASVPTLPSLLKEAGYQTVLVGKWHMGFEPHYGPLKSGYDRFFGIYDGAGDYFKNAGAALGESMGQLYDNQKPVDRIGYLTDELGSRAVAEIKRSAKSEAPLFMSLHFTAPHWPWEGPGDKKESDKLSSVLHLEGGDLETYAEMVRSMDANIGLVLECIREQGLYENTIVIFTSDNGGERFSDTWPLTGLKGELLEGGIRVPLLLRWPGHFPANTSTDQVVALMDLLPTLLAVGGAQPSKLSPPDGENLLDVLTGASPSRERKIFWRHKAFQQAAVREGDWKYLSINGKEHLFNVAEDPRERAEKKEIHPDIFQRLKADFEKWNKGMLPYSDENFSIGPIGVADRY